MTTPRAQNHSVSRTRDRDSLPASRHAVNFASKNASKTLFKPMINCTFCYIMNRVFRLSGWISGLQ
jgi:hypothetical protein